MRRSAPRHPDVGSLSVTTKMPGYSWGISPQECKTGKRLSQIKGSICSLCYAKQGNYRFPSVVACHARRLERYNADPVAWEEGMVSLLTGQEFFRWFDAGDLQSVAMLEAIFRIAERTPETKHWLNTREVGFVRAVLKHRCLPANVNVKLSAALFNNTPARVAGCTGAMAHTGAPPSGVLVCPAPTTGGACGDCRACWDKTVPLVTFKFH